MKRRRQADTEELRVVPDGLMLYDLSVMPVLKDQLYEGQIEPPIELAADGMKMTDLGEAEQRMRFSQGLKGTKRCLARDM